MDCDSYHNFYIKYKNYEYKMSQIINAPVLTSSVSDFQQHDPYTIIESYFADPDGVSFQPPQTITLYIVGSGRAITFPSSILSSVQRVSNRIYEIDGVKYATSEILAKMGEKRMEYPITKDGLKFLSMTRKQGLNIIVKDGLKF